MANIFFEQENALLHPPGLQMRERLQSAPEKLLKTPAKSFNKPLLSGRKALGTVNKVSAPSINVHKLLKPQETTVKCIENKVDQYPDIEKFIPYDPLEFEKYSIPEDLLPLSNLALPGLAQASYLPMEEPEMLIPLPDMSPVKMPTQSGFCSELDDFLLTLDKLTVEFPPESDADWSDFSY